MPNFLNIDRGEKRAGEEKEGERERVRGRGQGYREREKATKNACDYVCMCIEMWIPHL